MLTSEVIPSFTFPSFSNWTEASNFPLLAMFAIWVIIPVYVFSREEISIFASFPMFKLLILFSLIFKEADNIFVLSIST